MKEVESSSPRFESKLSKGECKLDAAGLKVLWRLTLTEGGGGRGGGNGGGRIECCGCELKTLSNALMLASSSSSPSLALGISERNSRSSDDRASEFRGLPDPIVLRRRENLFRKRETAEGAWTLFESICGSGASAYEVERDGAGAVNDVERFAGGAGDEEDCRVGDRVLSTLLPPNDRTLS